jgi:hypothetical protein
MAMMTTTTLRDLRTLRAIVIRVRMMTTRIRKTSAWMAFTRCLVRMTMIMGVVVVVITSYDDHDGGDDDVDDDYADDYDYYNEDY